MIRQIFRAIALRIITIAKCLFLLSYPLIVIFDIHVQVTVLKLDPGIKVFFACWKMSFLYKFYHDRQILLIIAKFQARICMNCRKTL